LPGIRDVGAGGREGVVRLEVDGRHNAGPAEALADGRLQVVVDQPLVLKLDLLFGGVDVHVDPGRINLQVDDVKGVRLLRQQIIISRGYRVVQVTALDEAIVDEEELPYAGFARSFRLADEAADGKHVRILPDRDKQFIVFTAEDLNYALAQLARRQGQVEPVVNVQVKADLRVRQGDADVLVADMPKLYRVTLEEVAAGRDVEEEVTDRDGRARGGSYRLLNFDFACFYDQAGAEFIGCPPGFHLHLGNGDDAGQGFAPESHGAQREEVVGTAEFARCVAFEGHAGVRFGHSATVVPNLNEGFTAVFYQ